MRAKRSHVERGEQKEVFFFFFFFFLVGGGERRRKHQRPVRNTLKLRKNTRSKRQSKPEIRMLAGEIEKERTAVILALFRLS